VGNASAISNSTTRSNWSADLAQVDYGSGPEQSFAYNDLGGTGSNPLGLGSDNEFFYTAGAAGSPFEIFANGPNGPVSCFGMTGGGCDPASSVPEPASVLLLGSGLVGFAFARHRKHKSSNLIIVPAEA
jgi:hypothetical protein